MLVLMSSVSVHVTCVELEDLRLREILVQIRERFEDRCSRNDVVLVTVVRRDRAIKETARVSVCMFDFCSQYFF